MALFKSYLMQYTKIKVDVILYYSQRNKLLFIKLLYICKDYHVKSSWKQRHATMAPMFATQSQGSAEEAMDTSMVTGDVRATQDLQQFTPTQAEGGGALVTQATSIKPLQNHSCTCVKW